MIPTKKRNEIWKITWAILIINFGAIQAQLESETEGTTELFQRDVIAGRADESTTWVGIEGVALTHHGSNDAVESTESAESATHATLAERQAVLPYGENEQTTDIASDDLNTEAGITERRDFANRSGANTESAPTESELASRQETVANTEKAKSGDGRENYGINTTEAPESTDSRLNSRQSVDFKESELDRSTEIALRNELVESESASETQESTESTESELDSRQESVGTEASELEESAESDLGSRSDSEKSTESVADYRQESSESTESDLGSRQDPVASTETVPATESELESRQESTTVIDPDFDSRHESTSSVNRSEPESTTLTLGEQKANASEKETRKSSTINSGDNQDDFEEIPTTNEPEQRQKLALQDDSPSTESDLESRNDEPTTESDLESRNDEPTTESDLESRNDEPRTEADLESRNEAPATEATPESRNDTPVTESDLESRNDAPSTESDLDSRSDAPATESDLESRNESPATESDLDSRSDAPETQSDFGARNDAPATESDLESRNESPATESDLESRNDAPATESDPESLNDSPIVELHQTVSKQNHVEIFHVALADEEVPTTEADPHLLSKSETVETETSSSTELNIASVAEKQPISSDETQQTTDPDLLARQDDALATTALSVDESDNDSHSAPATSGSSDAEESVTIPTDVLSFLSSKDAGEDNNEESATSVVLSEPAAVASRDGVHQPLAEKEADLVHSTTEPEEATTLGGPAAAGEDHIKQRNFGEISSPLQAKAAKHQYDNYRVYRVTLPTEDSTQTILKLEAHPGVDFWADPKLLLRPRGIFVTSATDIMVAPEALSDVEQFLDDENLPYEILIENIQDAINEENPDGPVDSELADRQEHPMTWDHYHTSEDIYTYLQYLTRKYPDDTSLIEIGRSPEGKPLQVLRVARRNDALRNRKALFFDAGMHAREWITPATLTYMIRELVETPANDCLMEKFEWYFLPVANPDGYDYSHNVDRMWRKNRAPNATLTARSSPSSDDLGVDPASETNRGFENESSTSGDSDELDVELFRSARPVRRQVDCTGTDLNRNFRFHWRKSGSSRNPCSESFAGSDSFSEPETQALAKFILERKDDIVLYVNLHAYSQMWLLPWGYTDTRPDDYAELFSLAKVGVRALEAVHNTSYLMGAIPDLLYKASGSAQDWAKGTAGVKYSYTIELRDAGRHGFLLPASQIIPTGEETWAAFKAVAQELSRRTYPGFWGRLIC